MTGSGALRGLSVVTRSFGMLMVLCRAWLKKHCIRP